MNMNIYEGSSRILEDKTVDGYRYIITSLAGRHPCAYIDISNNLDKLLELANVTREDDDYDIYDAFSGLFDVHGSFTYYGTTIPVGYGMDDEGFWLGWDYAHLGDYTSIYSFFGIDSTFNEREKKYTVEEIREECLNLIKELNNI